MNSKSLKEVSLVITKGTTPTTIGGKFLDSGINFVKSESIGQNKYLDSTLFQHIDEATDMKLRRSRLAKNDLLFSIAGAYLGKLSIVQDKDIPANTNQAVGIVRVDSSKVNVDYLYYYFSQSNINKYINKLSSQSSQPNLNLGLLGNLKFDNKPLRNQRKIAKILSDLDTKIELNNKTNVELEAMAKLIYDYWFVQFDFPDENGKPYKSSGGKMVYNEELKREIPEGWEVIYLTNEMDLQYGYPFSTKLFNTEELGVPVIRIRDIAKCTISNYSTEKVDEKYKIEKGDIIVGMDGNFHINYWNREHCYLNQRCLRIRSTSKSISHIQARYAIEPYIKAREKNVSRTTVAHLSARDVNDLKVIKAKTSIQTTANQIFKAILNKTVSNRKQNQKLSELRDWLLPMLMNGQVTVK